MFMKSSTISKHTAGSSSSQQFRKSIQPPLYGHIILISSLNSIPSGGMGTFGSLIIKSFGYNKFQTILFNLPFGAMTIIVTLGGGWLATKLRSKGLVIALLCVPTIAGIIVMLKIPHTPGNRGILLTGWYLVWMQGHFYPSFLTDRRIKTSLFPGITPLLYAWQAQNTAGDTKRKCTTGVLIVGMCTGNVRTYHSHLPYPCLH